MNEQFAKERAALAAAAPRIIDAIMAEGGTASVAPRDDEGRLTWTVDGIVLADGTLQSDTRYASRAGFRGKAREVLAIDLVVIAHYERVRIPGRKDGTHDYQRAAVMLRRVAAQQAHIRSKKATKDANTPLAVALSAELGADYGEITPNEWPEEPKPLRVKVTIAARMDADEARALFTLLRERGFWKGRT